MSEPNSKVHVRSLVVAILVLSAALVALTFCGKLTATHGGEYFNIARALSSGRGYADPFGDPTGPTAWMAPVYPTLLAGLYWWHDSDRGRITLDLVCLHAATLIGTGVLTLVLAWQTTRCLPALAAAALFLLATLYHFHFCFQFIDDWWLMLLLFDLLVAGICWLRPLGSWPRAAAWGLFGGLCALTNPIIGFAWGMQTLISCLRNRRWIPLGVAMACAGLALAPWTIRNYLVFGHLWPVKSNLAFELYQSQCLQKDGLLQNLHSHPSGGRGPEGFEYRWLGEAVFLERKWQQFCESVGDDPADFLDRVAARFSGVTVWYVPFHRAGEAASPWLLWLTRSTHPLPLLAILVLIVTNFDRPLATAQWTAIGAYAFYLLPYIAISYYERYAAPLLALKVLLVLWAVDRVIAHFLERVPGRSIDPMTSKAKAKEN